MNEGGEDGAGQNQEDKPVHRRVFINLCIILCYYYYYCNLRPRSWSTLCSSSADSSRVGSSILPGNPTRRRCRRVMLAKRPSFIGRIWKRRSIHGKEIK